MNECDRVALIRSQQEQIERLKISLESAKMQLDGHVEWAGEKIERLTAENARLKAERWSTEQIDSMSARIRYAEEQLGLEVQKRIDAEADLRAARAQALEDAAEDIGAVPPDTNVIGAVRTWLRARAASERKGS